MTKMVRLTFVALALCLASVVSAHAQTDAAKGYPNKPVRIIVGFSPGGPTDVIARIVAQKLSEAWGQQVYVENIAGAGSNTASVTAAKSAPDGYTVLAISTGFMVNASLYAKVPYDAVKDFVPVTMVAYSPNVIVVNPSVPAKTVNELIAEIKAHPGKYSFAGPGIGSTPHLSGELFKLRFGLDLVHIPFGGAGPAVQSTVAGHTPIAFTALPASLPQVKEGTLRALAILATKRVAALPDLPTTAESGVPDQESDTLTGLMMPAGTPRAIVDKWQQEIARIVAARDVADKLGALGFIPVANTPEEYGKRIDVEIKKWGKVIHDAKIPQIH
jgi:tripartite-type tricarboxylate transporter receptor subunit TctC